MTRKILPSTLALFCVAVPAAEARESFQRIGGVKSAGTPAKYNKVGILKIGSAKAKNILVLNPGTSASAAYFAPLARDLSSKAPGWQVWAVERRENLLEDHSVLNRLKSGTATPKQAFDYYLNYLADRSITTHFKPIPDASVAYAKQWGMRTEIGDLRRVVAEAKRAAGRRGHVVMGGHSLGGTITTAYATWDFGGKAGARGLSGLVFIDGASRPEAVTVAAANDSLAKLRAGSPWLTFGGIPTPFVGLFNTGGSLNALKAPNAPSLAQNFALLPSNLKPPVPATNLAQYGYALDTQTSPSSLALAQGHIGSLAHVRLAARLGAGQGHLTDQALRPDVLGRRARGPGRHRVVPPAAAFHRRRRRRQRHRQPGAEGAGRAVDQGPGAAQGSADLRLRRRPRRHPGAGRGAGAGEAVGDPRPERARSLPGLDLLAQRPELGLPQERLRRRPGAVPEGDPEAALMLRPLPDDFVATRLAMHRVAEDVMKPAREAVTGRFGLRACRGVRDAAVR